MADAARASEEHPPGAPSSIRSDALASRQRILRAARMLEGDRRVTMTELAAALSDFERGRTENPSLLDTVTW